MELESLAALGPRSSWPTALSPAASVPALLGTGSEAPGRPCCGRGDFDRADAASANRTHAADTITIAANPRMTAR